MAHGLQFGNLGQPGGFRTPEGRRNGTSLRHVENGKDGACAPGTAGFEYQFHSNASIAFASALISSFVRFSVTAISSWSRRSA